MRDVRLQKLEAGRRSGMLIGVRASQPSNPAPVVHLDLVCAGPVSQSPPLSQTQVGTSGRNQLLFIKASANLKVPGRARLWTPEANIRVICKRSEPLNLSCQVSQICSSHSDALGIRCAVVFPFPALQLGAAMALSNVEEASKELPETWVLSDYSGLLKVGTLM